MFLAPPPYYAPDGTIFLIDYFLPLRGSISLPVKFAPLCFNISRENTNYWCFTRSFNALVESVVPPCDQPSPTVSFSSAGSSSPVVNIPSPC